MAHTHYTAFTIQSGQFAGTQTDFPAVLSFTDNRFKTTGNGGHVAGSSGFDLRPYSDSGLTAALTFELVNYNASTGEFEMWVKIPSAIAGTSVIYLGYGDAALSSDGSSSATFSAMKLGAHYKDGTTLSVVDSSGNNTGTNVSATAVAGKVDGGIHFNGSSTYMYFQDTGNNLDPGTGNFSYSFWFQWSSFQNGHLFAKEFSLAAPSWAMDFINSDGTVRVLVSDGTNVHIPNFGIFSTGSWFHVAVIIDRSVSNAVMLIDGANRGITGSSGGLSAVTGTLSNASHLTIGMRAQENPGAFVAFDFDEFHWFNSAKSEQWFVAEYNNQSAPGTFFSTGTEQAIGGGGATILMGDQLN